MGKAGKRILCVALSLLLSVLVTLTLAVIAAGVYAMSLDSDLDDELFESAAADKTTRLFYQDRNGELQELANDRISGFENALYCPLSEIPTDLKNAFIAIEDKRFYSHGGIDWIRTGHAIKEYASKGKAGFGGSTITQQLIKNLTGESDRSVSRKAAELLRAVKAEKEYGKDRILEQYLNVVNLAENCYGVRTAANAYFSKEPMELTLSECATIAAITNNPAKYDPIRHPETNKERRDLILSEMLAQGMIGEEDCQNAMSTDVVLCVNEQALSGRVNSWYADLVVHDVIRDLMAQKGMSEAEASRLVYCGGLKIETCVDAELQTLLEEYYRNTENFPDHEDGKKAQSSMIIVDPHSGDILALVGAVGEKNSNRIQNYATDTRRPSGSVIKPLAVYAPALENDLITYGTVFDDVPRSYRKSGAPWPRNCPNVYRGLTTVNDALTHSVNTISVAVLNRLTTEASFDFLTNRLGFYNLKKEDKGVAALALGQQYHGVTLREVVGGYTALAGEGLYRGTRSYTKVYDRKGELLLKDRREATRALTTETAAITTMMLRHVVQSGTGKTLTLKTTVDVAGKTGTSGNNCDKWFIGYTPELLAGVWYGFEYPESLSAVSGNPALRVFDRLMGEAVCIRGVEKRSFDTPESVIPVRYCKDSGMLLSEACAYDPRGDRGEVGYFKKGTEPTEHCTCHTLIEYCGQSGVACADCPAEERHPVALLRVERNFPRQIYVMDAAYTYGGLCPERGQYFTNNAPYYAVDDDYKHFYGIGMEEVPFNRICPGHGGDDLSDDGENNENGNDTPPFSESPPAQGSDI